MSLQGTRTNPFCCFWCANPVAMKTIVCRECSVHDNPMSPVHGFAMEASEAEKKFVMHDFCTECFVQVERGMKFNDLREYTLLHSDVPMWNSVSAKVARFCPTKELMAAQRLMS